MLHDINFQPSGRGKAQCCPNENFPNGIELDATSSTDVDTCLVVLPYPASECGVWLVHCKTCGLAVGITAAGRADDPRSIKLPCNQIE